MSDSTLLTNDQVNKETIIDKAKNVINSIIKFFINFGKGFVEFFKNPKQGLKKCWNKIRSQKGWLFVLPAVILMCIFTFWPIINSLSSAFKENYNPLESLGPKYTGLGFENFLMVLQIGGRVPEGTGAEFLVCLKNTLILAFVTVPLSTALALLISVALNSIKAVQKAYQTIYFLPYLTNSLAMGAVFATFFNIVASNPMDVSTYKTAGLVNNLLAVFGVDPINWMNAGSSTFTNYIVIIIYEVWSGLPFKILILFSALQSVGKQYYDAAKVDSASKATVLWRITVPLISPMISYLLVTGIMGAMKSYSSIVGLYGEGMGPNSDYEMGTMVGYIYSMIENNQTGYAAAGSIILFLIIMVFTAINLYVSKKKVHY